MGLRKIGSLYQKKDRTGSIYLFGKLREAIPEGAYLYVFKNNFSGKKKYETSADFYACLQVDDETSNRKEGGE